MLPRWFANLFAGFRPRSEGAVPAPVTYPEISLAKLEARRAICDRDGWNGETPQSRVVASFPPGLSPEEHRRLVERAKLLHELMEREHR